MPYRVIEIQRNLLKVNSIVADRLRGGFESSGTLVVNILSSPGSGKTTLLEQTLARLPDVRAAVVVGDQATENDAIRLARTGAPVKQITTGAECRLDAQMIAQAIEGWLPDGIELLIIENVGNLICPAEYDLGEEIRVVLFSVTEGEDKPRKYPLAFHTAHLIVQSKMDLAGACDFDANAAEASMRSVNASAEIIPLSAKTGDGMDRWITFLRERLHRNAVPREPVVATSL